MTSDLLIVFGLACVAMNPMGVDPQDIPTAVMRVADRFGG